MTKHSRNPIALCLAAWMTMCGTAATVDVQAGDTPDAQGMERMSMGVFPDKDDPHYEQKFWNHEVIRDAFVRSLTLIPDPIAEGVPSPEEDRQSDFAGATLGRKFMKALLICHDRYARRFELEGPDRTNQSYHVWLQELEDGFLIVFFAGLRDLGPDYAEKGYALRYTHGVYIGSAICVVDRKKLAVAHFLSRFRQH